MNFYDDKDYKELVKRFVKSLSNEDLIHFYEALRTGCDFFKPYCADHEFKEIERLWRWECETYGKEIIHRVINQIIKGEKL